MKTKILSILLAISLLLGAMPLSAAAAPTFADVPETSWCFDAVEYLYKEGVVKGTTETVFSPKGFVKRGDFALTLTRLVSNYEPVTPEKLYSDVPKTYYTDAIYWATTNGIVSGTGEGKFSPEAFITREQMAKMLHFFVAQVDGDFMANYDDIYRFSDARNISGWARISMNWAVGSKVFSGDNQNRLNPKGKATRAEMAQMIYNAKDIFVGKSIAPETPVGDITLSFPGLGDILRIRLPNVWTNKNSCIDIISSQYYETTISSVGFRSKGNYLAGWGGTVGSIMLYDSTDYKILPNHRLIRTLKVDDTTLYVVCYYPTDIQFDYENSKLKKEYSDMQSYYEMTLLAIDYLKGA